ncbi:MULTISPECIES: Eco57I restriction-modification methylase domain-containing protein [Nostoc]|uniref:site-specific DNA-methyltransferase (adenine-specific) n=2 Tax=Nostoc TaxID=1177 RepID=A0ABR8IKT0_9NOSO|nr:MULTISPECIES: TaqI-like C-terminal specificity domain-containing protein [Nostoc]MBD2565792.1 Eco57I restriction-modification methylase domain-containing protein [Nostoc linckia FACHB-391]MBD2650920.1 Eco57I restriction-modification methylase domain-containing protein [Nostoc foliaceum FACHB-393]
MAQRLLQLDDVRHINSPQNVASLFQKIGYNASAQQLAVDDLELPTRSAEAIWDAYMIADHQYGNESLQVLLFQLQENEWLSNSTASNRMRSLAQSLCRRPSNFLLLGTKNYDQLMLVNPRKTFDADLNLKVSIRKLLIDRANPTNYDRDRLDAIAARNLSPQELYKVQCEAFDVEKLTKEFYRGYREIFEELQRVIKANNQHSYFNDSNRLHQFSQRLLGRVMFLYFLQKKEFLAGDRNFLKTQYNKLRSDLKDTDFYNQVLEPLFFEMLNKQRPNMDSPWGKIPYLNGGLFDRDYGLGVIDAAGVETPPQIELPNSLFDPSGDKGILRFFNSYNFTVSENVQGDEDVAVDPEMLGKVFENMLASEERGQSGTFYTPRGIVQFMCVESLSRYLADSTGMDLEAVKKLTEYDSELPGQDINQLLTKEQAKKLKQALNSVRICDPAVGSGAFPMGMMQVILSVKQAITHRTDGRPVQRGSITISQWKRDIIANNLYGVDIKPEAVEIAKLRMWLSLVVDIPDIDDVEPLPNLDYKLMCGDSLISTIQGEQLIPDPTKDQQTMLNVTPVQSAIQPLIDLQHQYFESHAQERKILRREILEAEKNVFRVAIADRLQYWQIEQRNLEQDIKRLKGKASRVQTQKQQAISTKLQELGQIAAEVERGMRSLNFFQWHLHFNEVFQQQGGFDIVIGNPPYVRQEQIKELKPALQAEYECYTGVCDLFVYFYERGFRLLKSGGHLSYITSNKYFRAGYGEKLRQFLGEKSQVQVLIDFGDAPVFEAIAYPSIILVSKSKPNNHQARVLNWEVGKSVDEFNSVYKNQSFYMPQKELGADGWRLESPAVLRLLDKLRSAGIPLGDYVNGRLYRGILTGLNETFVVDRETRDRLIAEHESSSEVLKPFLRGKDVKRWRVDYQNLWLIFTRRGIDITKYPAIYNYLLQYKERLTPGVKGGRKAGSYKWYEIQDNVAYWQEFKVPKIILSIFMNKPTFAFDNQGFFHNNALHLIAGADEYTTAILNSACGWWFIKQICTDLQNGYLQAYKENLEQIPIPTAPEADCLAIKALVQKCLDAKGEGVEDWEAEIDDRVAHLYGLTAEEMKIIKEG